MKRFLTILFWSVIPAAFIGPGTVTTCAVSGALHGYALLWPLVFSTVACVVLQEAATRVTVVSGRNLGQALRERFHGRASGTSVLVLVLGAIVLGCAAYEAGNILGAVSGAALGTALPPLALTLACGTAAGTLLWFGRTRLVCNVLGVTVGLMGVAFLATALLLRPPPLEVLRGSFLPTFPAGSGFLVLALIGTTVVPYNLFLGSGLSKGQILGDARFGLVVAVTIGGIISMGIVVSGTAVEGTFSFEGMAATLSGRLGGWAGPLFAVGLFAAGFSSAITAPMAAAVTVRGLSAPGLSAPGFSAPGFSGEEAAGRWGERSWRYRSVWIAVLLTGVGFGLAGVTPIPAILLAQAFNGVLLPLVAVFLMIVVNDRAVMGERGLNGPAANALMGVVVLVTLVLGASSVLRAAATALGLPPPGRGPLLAASGLAALIVATAAGRTVRRRRGTGVGRP